jgi:hypothetical protein
MTNWRPVLDPMKYPAGYADGFDRSKLYQFRYWNDGEVFSMRLENASPYMNVYGLFFKDPFAHNHSDCPSPT